MFFHSVDLEYVELNILVPTHNTSIYNQFSFFRNTFGAYESNLKSSDYVYKLNSYPNCAMLYKVTKTGKYSQHIAYIDEKIRAVNVIWRENIRN